MLNESVVITHDIEHEKKLIDLLGYNLIGPNNSNRWFIMDENNQQVGFIQYKKLFSKNDKKGYPATFGYRTIIDSATISYKSTRKIDNVEYKQSMDTKFSYSFDVKRENDDFDHVEIRMDENCSLNIWSQTYGYISFKVDYDGLYLDFKSKTENFNVEELVIYKSAEANRPIFKKEYTYQIRYCDKDLELSDDNLKGITIREISGICHEYYQESNHLKLSEKSWINGNLRTNRESEVTGTIEEMAIKHQMGIDAFHYFRGFINQILPFKKDIISAMLSEEIISKEGLSIFISELDRNNAENEPISLKREKK